MKKLLLCLTLFPLLGALAPAQSLPVIPALPVRGEITAQGAALSGASVAARPAPASAPTALPATPRPTTIPSTSSVAGASPAQRSVPENGKAGGAISAASSLPSVTQAIPGSYAVSLSGPRLLQINSAGKGGVWNFNLKNTGTAPVHLEHGVCDVRFEVLNAAGTVVRPDPKDTLCTMQLAILDVKPGETKTVQTLRWDGKDLSGQPIKPGKYTLRAKMVTAQKTTPTTQFQIIAK